jgi:RNA polymerase sigma-70 factor, ECF subfamily
MHFVTDPPVNPSEYVDTASSLLQRAASREQDAWKRMVALYGPLVYRWCRRWGLQPTDAENVGQDVFARVLSGLPRFRARPESGSFRGWLYRITRNCFVDYLRRLPRQAIGVGGSAGQHSLEQMPAEEIDQQEPTAREQDESLLYRRAIELIRAEFSPRDWAAFYQFVVERKTAAEIAEELQVSPNVVYLAKSRLLRRFRQEFGDYIDPE